MPTVARRCTPAGRQRARHRRWRSAVRTAALRLRRLGLSAAVGLCVAGEWVGRMDRLLLLMERQLAHRQMLRAGERRLRHWRRRLLWDLGVRHLNSIGDSAEARVGRHAERLVWWVRPLRLGRVWGAHGWHRAAHLTAAGSLSAAGVLRVRPVLPVRRQSGVAAGRAPGAHGTARVWSGGATRGRAAVD